MKKIIPIGLALALCLSLVAVSRATGARARDTVETPHPDFSEAAEQTAQPETLHSDLSEVAERAAQPEEASAAWNTVAIRYDEADISLDLPDGWAYEAQTKEMKDAESDLVLFGIDFWPEANPNMRLELGYWRDRIGMCGTGVTIVDYDFDSGLRATRFSETIEDTVWLTLIYNQTGDESLDGRVALSGDFPAGLWDQYEAEIMDIAGTVRITGAGVNDMFDDIYTGAALFGS